jgi:hypothetical protein
MSYLSTTIPIDVQPAIEAIKAIPKSFLHSVKLKDDLTGIEIVWDCDNIRTGLTAPQDYALEKLLPKEVVDNQPKNRRNQ